MRDLLQESDVANGTGAGAGAGTGGGDSLQKLEKKPRRGKPVSGAWASKLESGLPPSSYGTVGGDAEGDEDEDGVEGGVENDEAEDEDEDEDEEGGSLRGRLHDTLTVAPVRGGKGGGEGALLVESVNIDEEDDMMGGLGGSGGVALGNNTGKEGEGGEGGDVDSLKAFKDRFSSSLRGGSIRASLESVTSPVVAAAAEVSAGEVGGVAFEAASELSSGSGWHGKFPINDDDDGDSDEGSGSGTKKAQEAQEAKEAPAGTEGGNGKADGEESTRGTEGGAAATEAHGDEGAEEVGGDELRKSHSSLFRRRRRARRQAKEGEAKEGGGIIAPSSATDPDPSTISTAVGGREDAGSPSQSPTRRNHPLSPGRSPRGGGGGAGGSPSRVFAGAVAGAGAGGPEVEAAAKGYGGRGGQNEGKAVEPWHRATKYVSPASSI
jgi:hypothetical protein